MTIYTLEMSCMEQNCMAPQIIGKGIASWTDDNGNSDFDTEIRPCKIMAFIGHMFSQWGKEKTYYCKS